MAVMTSKKQSGIEDSLVRFSKIVLCWDYLRLFKESLAKKKDKTELGLKNVKDTYTDIDDYFDTYEPLLFEEVKAQILQGRKDQETDWIFGALNGCTEADEFHTLTIAYNSDEDERISQNDLLLLSKNQFQDDELPTTYAFALVQHLHPHGIELKMYLAGEVKRANIDEVKPCTRLLNMRSWITKVEQSIHMRKICSLSTIFREYAALRSISSHPFKDLILSAAQNNSDSEDRAWKIPGPLMESIKDNYNESQLTAIYAGLSRRTFVLIQGPPGTGKTQTILGLLSAILHATPARVHSTTGLHEVKCGPALTTEDIYRHWGQASPWLGSINPRDEIMPLEGDDGFFPTTGNDLKPEVVNSNRKYRVRVLVCAPSNSALDEIVQRILITGVRDESNHTYNPKIVRIGLKPHHSVKAVSMNYLVKQRQSSMDSSSDKHRQGSRRDIDSIRASILDEAVIVFSTLSFSETLFSKLGHAFDIVIIDEAAQAVEPATLIPLATKCKQVFLVGDPVQLPATVISPIAEKYGYGTSLFKRFQKAGYPVQMLKTQYRMHPEIRSFPSKEFYADELEDGPNVKNQTERGWHDYSCFGPFCFFDIHEGSESRPSGDGSLINEDETDFVLLLYHKLVTRHPELRSSSQLAIISPYRHQVKRFEDLFREKIGLDYDKIVDINTVDGFQGREKDVAIFSCVRANKDGGIGFLAHFQRMNVGITRARSSVLVVGSASTLRHDKRWNNLLESAEARNCLFKISKPFTSFFSDENMKSMEVERMTSMEEDKEEAMDQEVETNIKYGNLVGADDAVDADGDDEEVCYEEE